MGVEGNFIEKLVSKRQSKNSKHSWSHNGTVGSINIIWTLLYDSYNKIISCAYMCMSEIFNFHNNQNKHSLIQFEYYDLINKKIKCTQTQFIPYRSNTWIYFPDPDPGHPGSPEPDFLKRSSSTWSSVWSSRAPSPSVVRSLSPTCRPPSLGLSWRPNFTSKPEDQPVPIHNNSSRSQF